MPSGLGSADANGIWFYGESDVESLASDLLNIGQQSVSDAVGLDRDRLDDLERGLYCSLQLSASQNLTTSAAGVVWDVEASDPSGMHDNSTNKTRITFPVAGLYEVSVQLYNNNSSGTGTVYGRLNGTTDVPASSVRNIGQSGVGAPLKSVFTVAAAAADYVEIMVLHSAASGAIAGGAIALASSVTVKLIGA
ncbi:MAG TPA: hypothetical protein VGM94_02720 [Galbitalea sp.]|jgi:hypothetical protein